LDASTVGLHISARETARSIAAAQKVEVTMNNIIQTKRAEANETRGEPKTLRELGIDGALAAEFELVFRLMGAVDGDRVVGYTFSTPDGQRHALRVEQSETEAQASRAA
jgi:hypothetical protein